MHCSPQPVLSVLASFPISQVLQESDPAVLNVPASQSEQVADPAALNVPASQSEQFADSAVLDVPASHSIQVSSTCAYPAPHPELIPSDPSSPKLSLKSNPAATEKIKSSHRLSVDLQLIIANPTANEPLKLVHIRPLKLKTRSHRSSKT